MLIPKSADEGVFLARAFFLQLKPKVCYSQLRVFHISMRSVGETSGLDFPVARGTGPRERWIARTHDGEGTRSHARVEICEGPKPYGNARRFFGRIVLRSYGPEENKRRFFCSASDGEG